MKLAVSLSGFMGMATGLKASEFSEVGEDGLQHFRMNYYPPCPQPDQVIGCSPHTDITTISLLLELGDTPGLQIRKDGYWATVKPVPDAVDVIIGHITEVTKTNFHKPMHANHMKRGIQQRLCAMRFTLILLLGGRIMLRLHFYHCHTLGKTLP